MTPRDRPVPVIRLGSGLRLRLGDYVRLWKRVRDAERAGVSRVGCDLEGFDHRTPNPPAIVLHQFRKGLHDRINRHDPAYSRGRKWRPDWQRAALRVAGFANDPRLVYRPLEWRWIPRELRRALARRDPHDE